MLQIKPQSVEWMQEIPLAVEKVKEVGWYAMFERMGEYHIGVTRSFCQNFDRSTVNIGGLEFAMTEETIAHAIGIIHEGE